MLRVRTLTLGPIAGAALAVSGCLLLRDVDALDARTGTVSTPDDGGSRDGSEGGPTLESDGGDRPDAASSPGCPGDAGATMVRISGYCIDRTEVTVGQYRPFAASASTAGQRPECAWNTSFTPSDDRVLSRADDVPITFVDWCDAVAFCAWAGKRLCGAIGGGPLAAGDFDKATRSQWHNACTSGGTRPVPYGAFDPQVCSGATKGAGDVLPVGSLPGCVGPPGVYDLSGNVREWEDACEDQGGATSRCISRGGAFYDIDSTLNCDNYQPDARNTTNPGIGFRCCAL